MKTKVNLLIIYILTYLLSIISVFCQNEVSYNCPVTINCNAENINGDINIYLKYSEKEGVFFSLNASNNYSQKLNLKQGTYTTMYCRNYNDSINEYMIQPYIIVGSKPVEANVYISDETGKIINEMAYNTKMPNELISISQAYTDSLNSQEKTSTEEVQKEIPFSLTNLSMPILIIAIIILFVLIFTLSVIAIFIHDVKDTKNKRKDK